MRTFFYTLFLLCFVSLFHSLLLLRWLIRDGGEEFLWLSGGGGDNRANYYNAATNRISFYSHTTNLYHRSRKSQKERRFVGSIQLERTSRYLETDPGRTFDQKWRSKGIRWRRPRRRMSFGGQTKPCRRLLRSTRENLFGPEVPTFVNATNWTNLLLSACSNPNCSNHKLFF